MKFSHSGRYMLTRDYLTVKVWDLNMEARPIETYQVGCGLETPSHLPCAGTPTEGLSHVWGGLSYAHLKVMTRRLRKSSRCSSAEGGGLPSPAWQGALCPCPPAPAPRQGCEWPAVLGPGQEEEHQAGHRLRAQMIPGQPMASLPPTWGGRACSSALRWQALPSPGSVPGARGREMGVCYLPQSWAQAF